jgi:hypothetical protein
MNKKRNLQSSPMSFKPYAIALSNSKRSISKLQKTYPPLSESELEPGAIELANQCFYQIGIDGRCLGLTCHVFRLTNADLLGNMLSALPDVHCYAIQDLSDEALARRYFAAIRAIRKAQYKVEKTAFFAKPSKQLIALCPQTEQELASVRSVIEQCSVDLQRQHKALCNTISERLRVQASFQPRQFQQSQAA